MSKPAWQRALGGRRCQRRNVADVVAIHAPGLDRIAARRASRARQGRLAARQVRDIVAAEPQLAAGERAMPVNRLGHQGLRRDIALVPRAGLG